MFNQPFPLLYVLGKLFFCCIVYVHQMLQKCMLTVDPSQVQHLLDHLGEGYDQAFLECQDQLADSLKLK